MFLFYTFINSDMVQKTNPKTSDIVIADGGNYEVSSRNFSPKISLMDDNGIYYQYFDPQIWNFHFVLYSSNPKTIDLVNCSQGQSLCLGNSSNFFLNHDVHIGIDVNMCVNSSESDIVCKPIDEIYNFIERIGFTLDFSEVSFDLNNYDNPLEKKQHLFQIGIVFV